MPRTAVMVLLFSGIMLHDRVISNVYYVYIKPLLEILNLRKDKHIKLKLYCLLSNILNHYSSFQYKVLILLLYITISIKHPKYRINLS